MSPQDKPVFTPRYAYVDEEAERAAIQGAAEPWDGQGARYAQEDDAPVIVAEVNEAAQLPAAPEEKPRCAIAAAWKPLSLDMLTEPPPARRWLLRHPTRDGQPCPAADGDGMLPLGKVGLLAADGGVGKTMALLALAVSTITGRPWLGHFEIGYEARRGRVLLALAEEDEEEVRRRLFAVASAYRLDARELARVVDRLVVLPLAGRAVSLLGYGLDGRTLIDSAELGGLREQLARQAGEDGWSLVGLDPFARWAGDDAEKDNAVATRTLQAAEALLEAPGRPTVLLAHHVSLDGMQTGRIKSRGATGIRNGARWEAVLREDGPDVYFRQTKSNYSRGMPDEIRLVRGPGGMLRVASTAEEQERQERVAKTATEKQAGKDAAKDAHERQRNEALRERLLAAIREHAGTEGVRGAEAACKLAEVKPATGRAIVNALLTEGAVVDHPVKGKPRLFPAPPPASAP